MKLTVGARPPARPPACVRARENEPVRAPRDR